MNTHITEWLAAYHDGELRGRRLAQVEAHLETCADCQSEMHQIKALSRMLAEAPEAEMITSSDRFAAQVGLQLKRRPHQEPAPAAQRSWVWTAMPVSLLIGIGFVQVVQWMANSFSLAQVFGYGEAAVSRLTITPPQAAGVFAQIPNELIRFGVPFSPQLLLGLILPAILAVGYMVWLIVWSLNQREIEATQL